MYRSYGELYNVYVDVKSKTTVVLLFADKNMNISYKVYSARVNTFKLFSF